MRAWVLLRKAAAHPFQRRALLSKEIRHFFFFSKATLHRDVREGRKETLAIFVAQPP